MITYFMLVQKAFFVAGYGLKDITLETKLFLLKVSPVGQSCFMCKRKAHKCFRPWSQKEPLMSWQVRKCWIFQPMVSRVNLPHNVHVIRCVRM